mmetsp:Transcript_39164/g.111054  ORF Transcript_39164/g.111054 Transcript_39164/m.111054 type:complete len:525 (+) Transcript_39164:73-1647(+)
MTLEDDEQIDDMTIGLQMQQFLDEWHFRVLNANMATTWNRTETLVAAMDLFEAHGLVISAEEKWDLASGSEDRMVDALVSRMSPQLRRSFEHFTLQLQLIISTATRVRAALEDADESEVTRIIEDGDTGITQNILKQTVIEAAAQVGDKRDIKDSWAKSMSKRVERLARVAHNTKAAQEQYERITMAIDQFSENQSSKSAKVLVTMMERTDHNLMKSVLMGWAVAHQKQQTEKHIRDKYEKMIEDAKAESLEMKSRRLENLKKALMHRAHASEHTFQLEIFRIWAREVGGAKEEREAQEKIKEQKERLSQMKAHHAHTAKQSMTRFAQGSESAMRSLCFQTWASCTEELRHEREADAKKEDMQKRMQGMSAKSKEETEKLLERMKASSDSGLTSCVFTAWAEDVHLSRRARDFDEQINKADQKFATLKSAQKKKAANVAERAIELEKENLTLSVFMNWHGEVKLARVIRHYSGKMTAKKEQLEAVRQMFNKFANDLGEINQTPRTKARSQSRSKGHAVAGPSEQ